MILRWSVARLGVVLCAVTLALWLVLLVLLARPVNDLIASLFPPTETDLLFATLAPFLFGYGLTAGSLFALAVQLREKTLSQLVDRIHGAQADHVSGMSMEGMDPAISGVVARSIEVSARHRVLDGINQRIGSCMQLEAVLPEITKSAVELLGATSGTVTLSGQDGIQRYVGVHNIPHLLNAPVPQSKGVAWEVGERGKAVIVADYSKYERRLDLLDSYGFRGVLGVPLVSEGESVGALVVSTCDPGRRFTQDDVELLASFGNQAAITIRNARLHSENLQRMDELRRAKMDLARRSAQLRRLLSKTFRSEEEVRRRISADIHDGITQLVVGALYQIQSVRPLLRVGSLGGLEVAMKRLETAYALLNQTVDEMHRVVHDLRPLYVDEMGIVDALRRYTASVEVSSGLKCQIELTGTVRKLNVDKQLAIYRIVQEALNNVRKHAGTPDANIFVQFRPDKVIATVQDYGRGFDMISCLRRVGENLGITDMEERAHAVGGSVQINSAPGRGTAVVLEVPVTPEEEVIEEPGAGGSMEACQALASGREPAS